MAEPPTFTVTGVLINAGSVPQRGIVVVADPLLRGAKAILDGDMVIVDGNVSTTNDAGEFTLTLLASPGLYYRVYARASRVFRPVVFQAPAPGTVLEFADLASGAGVLINA